LRLLLEPRRTVCEEFELTGAEDVHEVLGWIDDNAAGREVEALVVVTGCDVATRDALGVRRRIPDRAARPHRSEPAGLTAPVT